MKAKIMMGAIAVSAAALVGCGADVAGGPNGSSGNEPKGPNGKTTGTVEFNLDLDNGETTDTIDLHLVCTAAGIDQTHVLDVVDGEVEAAFSGLSGACTATMHTQTNEGTDCDGSSMFTVTPGTVTPVTVTLTCQGYGDMGGQVTIDTDFEFENCSASRILKVYAIPSNILTGESTTVEVETIDSAIVGTPHYTYSIVNEGLNDADGTLSMVSCAPNSDSCQQLLCETLGSAVIDADTGLPTDGLYVQVTLEDDECRDSERVLITCAQASVCGNGGAPEGAEQCDDGNTLPNDGCGPTCRLEICGDGILQTGEACDGLVPVLPPGQSCSATCTVITAPFCGDNIVNQASEQCDGTATPAMQTCGAPGSGATACKIIPVCGNTVEEAGEECDDGNLANGDGCDSTCQDEAVVPPDPEMACRTCVTTGQIAADFTNDFCSVSSDADCNAVLQCYVTSTCFATFPSVTDCYCGSGADTGACLMPGFTPTGPCAAVMKTAAGGASATNADVLNNLANINPPFESLGWAAQIMSEAQLACPAACHF